MIEKFQNITRISVPALDKIIGNPLNVLDDGFIRVIDYMGTDESIVQAARVSYGKGTKNIHEDRGLIRYLIRHRHTTPFEMCEIKLHIRVPMDCWRQWIRHRTANVNEYSTRYSVAIDSAQKTKPDEWRRQSTINKQGSEEFISKDIGEKLTKKEEDLHSKIREIYEKRLSLGVAREQSRKDLPLSTFTEAYWKIDLHNLLHFLSLRMDKHAQSEIRSYANIIGYEIVSKWCPITWEAFLDYRLNALSFSKIEIEIINRIGLKKGDDAISYAIDKGLLSSGGTPKKNREREELEDKLETLNLPIPWRKDL